MALHLPQEAILRKHFLEGAEQLETSLQKQTE